MARIQSVTINNFAAYGLNRRRNFMTSPKCGCGGKAVVCLDDIEEVKEFCKDMLMEHGCPEAAIFCVFKNGTYAAVVKQPDDLEEGQSVLLAIKPTKDRELFSDVDAEFRLCCYGMITEVNPGEWNIEE